MNNYVGLDQYTIKLCFEASKIVISHLLTPPLIGVGGGYYLVANNLFSRSVTDLYFWQLTYSDRILRQLDQWLRRHLLGGSQ